MTMRPQNISSSSSSSGGVGVIGLLQVVFVVLKLIHADWNPVQYWAWWQVLLPMIISSGIGVLLVLIAIGYLLIREMRK